MDRDKYVEREVQHLRRVPVTLIADMLEEKCLRNAEFGPWKWKWEGPEEFAVRSSRPYH